MECCSVVALAEKFTTPPAGAKRAGSFNEIGAKTKRSQNTRPSDTASTHCGSYFACQRNEVREVVNAGRLRQ